MGRPRVGARFQGGHPPLGYQRDRAGALVVDARRASVVRTLFREYPRRGSLARLAAFLAGKRIHNRGRPWSRQALLWILRNAVYRGGTGGGKGHPAIIPARAFARVQRLLARRRRNPAKGPKRLEERSVQAERNVHGNPVIGR